MQQAVCVRSKTQESKPGRKCEPRHCGQCTPSRAAPVWCRPSPSASDAREHCIAASPDPVRAANVRTSKEAAVMHRSSASPVLLECRQDRHAHSEAVSTASGVGRTLAPQLNVHGKRAHAAKHEQKPEKLDNNTHPGVSNRIIIPIRAVLGPAESTKSEKT